MTQAAREAASCCWYLGLLRKLSWPAVADSSGARPSIGRLGVAAELAAERFNDRA